ncbi:MAG TPA: hypothetical protein VK623_04500 [Flavobacterium sp.]|nr:hypothetical protein [Flavobacterium sp.]
MKTKLVIFAFFASLMSNGVFAQDKTTVTATNTDISDNLDLKAVASIFGDSKDLEDFERRLNDPDMQISNLDLNGDNEVDYLRVIESVEGNTHLIIIQSVLDKDVYQDVATVEVEKDANNNVQVQVVGDVYMYGSDYIYEPVYITRPIIYDYFWIGGYHPYYSSWYWGYYPSYYHVWHPYPIYRYRRNIHVHINTHNHYNYVHTRRSARAAALYNTRRSNGYEVRHPENSFTRRNPNVTNRHELTQTRRTQSSGTRSSGTRSGLYTPNTRNAAGTGGVRTHSANTRSNGTRTTTSPTRANSNVRTNTSGNTRSSGTTRATIPASGTRNNTSVRTAPAPGNVRTNTDIAPASSGTRIQSTNNINTRVESPRVNTRTESPGPAAQQRIETPRVSPSPGNAPRQNSAPRNETPQRNEQRGGRR